MVKSRAKKFIKGIVLALLCVVILLLLIVYAYPHFHDQAKIGTFEGSASWMENISDELLLSEISIPGVHDAGTNYVDLPLFSKCQDSSIAQQLDAGYRYFDIRLGVKEICDEPCLIFYHGFTECKTGVFPWDGELMLDLVVEDMRQFLKEHPTETILFVVKQEHGDESTAVFQKIFDSYISNDDIWLLTDEMPTLIEARGKIVLFRRYEDEAELGENAGFPLIWIDQRDNSDVTKSFEENENEGFTLFVQDRFKYNSADKWNAFYNTCVNATGGCVRINFSSTNGTPTYGHPFKYAKELNQLFLQNDYHPASPQWVIVDFGTEEMAQKIIAANN